MAIRTPDLVKVTTSTSGNGTYAYTEVGVSNGYRSFTDAVADTSMANGDQVFYEVRDSTAPGTLNLFERGLGTVDVFAKTMTRDVVYQSSSGGGAVTWGAGTRDLYVTSVPQQVIALLNAMNKFEAKQFIYLTGASFVQSAATALALQNSNSAVECWLTILAAANAKSRINMTDPTAGETGGAIFDYYSSTHATKAGQLEISTAGAVRVRLDAANGLRTAADVKYEAFPSGTKLLFGGVPPSGWTRVNASEDRVIKIAKASETEGNAGGAWTISGVTVDATSLNGSQLAAHAHLIKHDEYSVSAGAGITVSHLSGTGATLASTEGNGSGASHTHTLTADGTWRPRYEIWAAATKD